MQEIKITVELIPDSDEGGFTVYCPELDIYTQGDDEEEALKNIKEAAEVHIQEIGIDKIRFNKVIRKELQVLV